MQGVLSEETAEWVLRNTQTFSPGGVFPEKALSPVHIQEMVSKYAKKYNFDKREMQHVINKMALQQQQISEELTQRVEEQTKATLDLLGEIPDIRKFVRAKAIKALQDHWWVQFKKGNNWINLDPTLLKSKPDATIVKTEDTYQPADLDKDIIHLVTIRVIIEQWDKGKLREHKVLEHTLQPSKLFGEQIVLRHIPINWPEDLNQFTQGDSIGRLKTSVLKVKEWLPVLTLGSERIVKSSFTDAGEVNKEPGKNSDFGLLKGFSPFGGFSGELSGREPEEEFQKTSHLTAEWIEFEIRVPGESKLTKRRLVFDLIGPAKRSKGGILNIDIAKQLRLSRGLALIGGLDILIQVSHMSRSFVRHLTIERITSNRDILFDFLGANELSMGKSVFEKASKLTPLPGIEYKLAEARLEWNRFRDHVYLSKPNILCHFVRLRIDQHFNLEVYRVFDIVENEVSVEPDQEVDPFQIQLEQRY